MVGGSGDHYREPPSSSRPGLCFYRTRLVENEENATAARFDEGPGLRENVERAMQAEPVRRKTGDGEEEVPGEFVYNGSVANKALELLGKELGMFIDRKEVGGPNEFDRMSDEELRAFLEEPIESAVRSATGHSKQKH